MNKLSNEYWNEFWGEGKKPKNVSAWQFGGTPDYLAQLVIDGIKTATCSAYDLYQLEGAPLPQVGEYSIVLNGKEEPACIIQTTEVQIIPFNEVSEQFAFDEGEGDRSYTYWKDVHVDFFTDELNGTGNEFCEDMLVVCERFKLVHVKGGVANV